MSPLNTMRTDLGNAERFVERHGKDVRYVAPWKRWIYWTGTHWARDDTFEIQRLAKESVRSMWSDVPDLPRDETGDWVKHIMKSESDARLRALVDLARAEPSIAIMPEELDRDPWLLAVQNGVLDLRTGRLGPNSRELMITKLVPASFDPESRCDKWEEFLRRVLNGSAELIDFLQRAVGYSLTGSTSARVLFFLYGMGANGKSTFLEILRALLAGYAQQADFTSFLDTNRGDGPRNDIARLFGARVVTSSEVGEGKRLNESLVKTLTGKDTVTARFLHAEYFEYKPQFKLWLAANHRPVIRGTDSAIWDRVRLIPFTISISPEERDPELVEKLLAELSGILAWSVAGCLHWRQRGLAAPSAVTLATDTYRKDSDTLGAFLEECCDLAIGNANIATPATELYLAYRKWAEIGGEYVLPQTTFGRRLEERGITAEKRGRDRARVKWRLGVRLIDPMLAGDPREPYRSNGIVAQRQNADNDRSISREAGALL
jgi:putative DNA primase/helicase